MPFFARSATARRPAPRRRPPLPFAPSGSTLTRDATPSLVLQNPPRFAGPICTFGLRHGGGVERPPLAICHRGPLFSAGTARPAQPVKFPAIPLATVASSISVPGV